MAQLRAIWLFAISFTVLFSASTPAKAPENWTFTSFSFPNDDVNITIAYDINDEGDAVGRYTLSTEVNHSHGFLRMRNGEFRSIDVPGANFSVALGINGSGDIVGPYRLPSDPMSSRRGFILRDGVFSSFSVPDPNAPDGRAVWTQPLSINDNGDIVGRFCRKPANCVLADSDTHGFLRTGDGDFFTLDVPGAVQTTAWKINNDGQIVGAYLAAAGRKIHLFQVSVDDIKDSKSVNPYKTIDLLPVEPIFENGGISDDGDIVGSFCEPPSPPPPQPKPCFGQDPTRVFRGFHLNSDGAFSVIDFPGALNTFVNSISPGGEFITGGINRGNLSYFAVSEE